MKPFTIVKIALYVLGLCLGKLIAQYVGDLIVAIAPALTLPSFTVRQTEQGLALLVTITAVVAVCWLFKKRK